MKLYQVLYNHKGKGILWDAITIAEDENEAVEKTSNGIDPLFSVKELAEIDGYKIELKRAE